MSKPTNVMTFSDDDGMLCAVRMDYCTEEEAMQIAKEKLFTENVKLTKDYRYMHHGFGKTVNMDEYENTWWLTDEMKKNSVAVYVFREA